MFGSAQSGASAYAKIGLETGVTAANPHQLIVMLFDGALAALGTAQQCMKERNIPGKGQAISKAITIVDSGLRASLNKDVGGEIAQNLDALYEYISSRMLLANLNNDPALLDEATRLLRDLKGAWEAIAPEKTGQSAPASEPAKASAYDSLEPRMTQLAKA